jgi:hypothetical protein
VLVGNGTRITKTPACFCAGSTIRSRSTDGAGP